MHAAVPRKPVHRCLACRDLARLLGVAALALVVAGLVAAPALAQAGASPPRKSDLRPLWQQYPVNAGAGRVGSTTTGTQPTRRQPRPAAAKSDNGGGASLVVPLAAAGACLLLGVVAFLVFPGRRAQLPSTKGAKVTRFRSKRSEHEDVKDVMAEKEPVAMPVDPQQADAGAEPSEVGSPEAASQPVTPQRQRETPAASEPGRVAEHVGTVLKAAEDAAAKMIEDARAQAEEIRQAAEREAAARVEAAQASATRLQAETEQAHAKAAAVTNAAARYDELLSDTALAEDRLRRLVGGLRQVADRLDGLLMAPADADAANAADDSADEAHASPLVERLEANKTKAGVGTQ
jgi:hypothetical protein